MKNLTDLFNRVVRERISIVVEKREALVVLRPVRPKTKRPRKKSAAARKAFLAAAGSWKGIDTDKFLADNRASRNNSIRPHVEL